MPGQSKAQRFFNKNGPQSFKRMKEELNQKAIGYGFVFSVKVYGKDGELKTVRENKYRSSRSAGVALNSMLEHVEQGGWGEVVDSEGQTVKKVSK